MEALRALLQQLLGIWKELGINQKITVMVSGVVMLIGLGVVVFYTSRAEYTLLYGGLDSAQAGKVTAALEERIEGVKELFLRLLAAADELDVVDDQHVHVAVLLAELLHRAFAQRRDEFVRVGLGRIDAFGWC